MTRIDELSNKMIDLIEAAQALDDHVEFNTRAREIINEIAEFAKHTKLYADFRERSETFWGSDDTPTDIYFFVLQKVVNAPTPIHRDAAVLLHMPALAEALQREESKVEYQRSSSAPTNDICEYAAKETEI